MFNLSPLELGVIAGVIVLLFGTRKLPELGSGLGKAIKNFRSAFKEGDERELIEDLSQTSESDSEESKRKKVA